MRLTRIMGETKRRDQNQGDPKIDGEAEETVEQQRILEQETSKWKMRNRVQTMTQRKTHELDRIGVDEFGGDGSVMVEKNSKVMKDHSEEHPNQERELSEFEEGVAGSSSGIRVCTVLKIINPKINFRSIRRAYIKTSKSAEEME